MPARSAGALVVCKHRRPGHKFVPYMARIEKSRHDVNGDLEYLVHYDGYKIREWVGARTGRIRNATKSAKDEVQAAQENEKWHGNTAGYVGGGKYEVEEIIGLRTVARRREVLVKWVGHEAPTWEPASNFDNEDVEELEEDLQAESRAAAKASAKPPKPPRVPYTVAAAAREAAPEAVRVARVRDASLLRKAIAKAAVKELRKERDGRAKRAVFSLWPCAPHQYVALRDNYAEAAAQRGGGSGEAAAVTAIEAKIGMSGASRRVADRFFITNASMLADELDAPNAGNRATFVRPNGTTMVALPVWAFKFSADRDDETTGTLTSTLHIAGLVPGTQAGDASWDIDENGGYAPAKVRKMKEQVAEAIKVYRAHNGALKVPKGVQQYVKKNF
jgi:hypothetical protein